MIGKRGKVFILVGLLTVGTVAGVLIVRRLHIAHFRTVVDGKIYRSGQPIGSDWARLRDDYGIRTVINLRPVEDRDDGDWFEQEKQAVAKYGMTWLNVPMDDECPSKEQVDQVLAVLADPVNRPILLHCKRGRDRTGVMAALYRIHVQGWSKARAVEEMEDLRDGEAISQPVRDFLHHYCPSGTSTSPD